MCFFILYIYIYIYMYIYIYIYITVHHVPKCMSCHKAIVVITGRAHCFYDNIYIMLIVILWDFSTLCVADHLWPLMIFVFIHKTSVGKSVHVFTSRNKVSKSCLMAELFFHRFAHFDCVPIYIFGFHHKQCASG